MDGCPAEPVGLHARVPHVLWSEVNAGWGVLIRMEQSENSNWSECGTARYLVEQFDAFAVVTAEGEVDLRSVPGLSKALKECADRSRSALVEMSGVTFIDSTGLGALIAAHRRARAHGGSVSVVNPPKLVRHVLTVTGLEHALGIFTSMDEALETRGVQRHR